MSDIRIANRYAKSILDLAVEKNELEQVTKDIDMLNAAFESRELYNLIKSPIIGQMKKLSIFSTLFSGKISNLTQAFLERVIKKGRESIIPEMLSSFHSQFNDRKGIVAVELTTMPNLGADALEQIKGQVRGIVGAGKDVTINVHHDDSLIGGFVLEYEDKKYDASVKHKLNKLKKSFSA